MSRVAIVTDSTCDLTSAWAATHGVTIVPLSIAFGDEVFLDGVDIDRHTFYRKLKEASDLPSSAQPSVGQFLEVYRRLAPDHDEIVSIHIGSEYSGTLSSARTAAIWLKSEQPDGPTVHFVDSHTTSGPLALMVTAAVRGVAAGKDGASIVRHLESLEPDTRSYFTLVTLEYFRRGGRIGAASAFAGSLLQIRPIMTIGRGQVGVEDKVRTTARARRRMLEIFVDAYRGHPVRAAIVHADDPEAAAELERDLRAALDCREVLVVEFGAAIGTHGGAGALGVGGYVDREAEWMAEPLPSA